MSPRLKQCDTRFQQHPVGGSENCLLCTMIASEEAELV